MEVKILDPMAWTDTVSIVPIGDIQLGAQGVDLRVLREDIERGLSLPNPVFIGLGDYIDVASPSGRQKIRNADFYDSVLEALNDRTKQQLDELMTILKPTVGLWAGVLQGHHYMDFEDGTTSDTMLAKFLQTDFLGDSAFLRFRWKRGGTSSKLDVFCTHGTGSGQTQSAPLNKLERFAGGVHADLYLINHYARRGAQPADVLSLSHNGNLEAKTIFYMSTGGYMRAYEQGSKKAGRPQGSYVEKAMMKPTALGGGYVTCTPRRRKNSEGIEIHEIEMEVTV